LVGVTAAGQGKVHSNNDDPTGRHPGKTKAAFPKALNERADLVGQSYRERHRGQPALGRKRRFDPRFRVAIRCRIVRPLKEPTEEEKAAKWDKSEPPQIDKNKNK